MSKFKNGDLVRAYFYPDIWIDATFIGMDGTGFVVRTVNGYKCSTEINHREDPVSIDSMEELESNIDFDSMEMGIKTVLDWMNYLSALKSTEELKLFLTTDDLHIPIEVTNIDFFNVDLSPINETDKNLLDIFHHNPEEKKWYGWNHRTGAVAFGVGDSVKRGDVAFHPSNKEEWEQDQFNFWTDDEPYYEWSRLHTNVRELNLEGILIQYKYTDTVPNKNLRGLIESKFIPYPESYDGRGEWTAETLEDAKQMAIDFARGVS